MRCVRRISVLGLAVALLLGAGGCGNDSASNAYVVLRVEAITGPLPAGGGAPFTITGSRFLSVAGADVTVRFVAEAGTPFDGGTSASKEVPGVATSNTTVTGLSPSSGGLTFNAFVTVILPSTAKGTSKTPIAMFLGGPPMPMDDEYDAIGNVQLDVSVAEGLLANDEPMNVYPVSNAPALTTTTMGGTLSVNADGSFTYDAPLGFEGVDTFDYEVDGGSAMASVTITVTDVVWFVDSDAAGGGDGRDSSPFDSLAAFDAVNGGGGGEDPEEDDYVFLFNRGVPYAGNVALENGQQLIGQGVDLVVGSVTVVAGTGMNSQIEASTGSAVSLGSDNTLRGLDIGNTAGAGIMGVNAGALTVSDCTLNTTGGEGLLISNAVAADFALDAVTVDNSASGDDGIQLVGNTGAFTFSDVDVTTGSGAGISLSGSGVVSITGTNNVISSTTGTALIVTNTTIGAAGLTFTSISVDGAPNGIVLSDTGSLGGLTVTGDGGGVANASGGQILNTTGVGIDLSSCTDVLLSQMDVTDSASHGIRLVGVTNFTFRDADITGAGSMDDEHGISASNLFGTSLLENVTFDQINEDGIELVNTMADDGTTDALTVDDCSFLQHTGAGFAEHGIDVQATGTSDVTLELGAETLFKLNANGAVGVIATSTGTSTLRVTIDDCDFDAVDAFGSGCVELKGTGASSAIFTVSNSRFDDSFFTAIIANCDDTATTTVTIENNDIDQDTGNGGFGISLRQDGDGLLTALVDNNTIQDTGFDAIRVNARDGAAGDRALNATITNNLVVNAPSTFGAGIAAIVADDNALRLHVSGNDVVGSGTTSPFDDDIFLDADDTATMSVTQTSAADVSTQNTNATVGIGAGIGTINFDAGITPAP